MQDMFPLWLWGKGWKKDEWESLGQMGKPNMEPLPWGPVACINSNRGRAPQLTPIVLATQEAEISQPRQILHETLSRENPS
jgi:hypothetical protein